MLAVDQPELVRRQAVPLGPGAKRTLVVVGGMVVLLATGAVPPAIAGLLAEQRGDFVTATAGHHMESMLAAYGSGASKVSYDGGKRILNIDIGGGTTKLAVIAKGKVVATAAVHIGGRLQVVDTDQRIVRLDPAGRQHAARAGFSWSKGDLAEPAAAEHRRDDAPALQQEDRQPAVPALPRPVQRHRLHARGVRRPRPRARDGEGVR